MRADRAQVDQRHPVVVQQHDVAGMQVGMEQIVLEQLAQGRDEQPPRYFLRADPVGGTPGGRPLGVAGGDLDIFGHQDARDELHHDHGRVDRSKKGRGTCTPCAAWCSCAGGRDWPPRSGSRVPRASSARAPTARRASARAGPIPSRSRTRTSRCSRRRSRSNAGTMPGRRTLTITAWPLSLRIARWTWAIEAAAKGVELEPAEEPRQRAAQLALDHGHGLGRRKSHSLELQPRQLAAHRRPTACRCASDRSWPSLIHSPPKRSSSDRRATAFNSSASVCSQRLSFARTR